MTADIMQTGLRPKKRVFLALILASLGALALGCFLLWRLVLPGLGEIHVLLPKLLAVALVICIAVITFAVLGMILTIMGINKLNIFRKPAWYSVNMLFPLAVLLGKIFDIHKESIERSFIEVSNHLVKQNTNKFAADKILILTPHCIQLDTCPHKITRDINNCKQCGGCPVGSLLELKRKYGVHVAVVTGGTLARQVVRKLRPHAILAIACERDLTSGIQDVFPLPVIGVLNSRPCGPCCNTQVDMKEVEKVIRIFTQTEEQNETTK